MIEYTPAMTKTEVLAGIEDYARDHRHISQGAAFTVLLVLLFPWTQAHPGELDGDELIAVWDAGYLAPAA